MSYRIIAALIIITIIMFMPIPRAENNYIKLILYVKLLDDTPLSQAIVIIKPTIYSTCEVINTTNSSGYVEIFIDRNLFGNKPYLVIKYWIYGEIYHGYINLSATKEQIISIKLNYTTLQGEYRVINEYLEPLNGTYFLVYKSGNEFTNITKGRIISGIIHVNYTKHTLLFNNKLADNYIFIIKVKNKTIKAKLSGISNNTIIVDTEKPIIQIIDKKATYNKKSNTITVTILLKVIDGIYSEKVRLNGYIVSNNRKALLRIEKINATNKDHLIILYYSLKTTILNINISKIVDIYITASDPTGKLTITKTIIPIEIIEASQTTSQNHSNTTTPININTSITTTKLGEETSSNETFIPNNVISQESSLNYFLVIATIALILLTIYLDIKHFHREE
ncbi:MAG: hypothetical protein J7J82_08925 [Staphylothermus sp.]|nr:hypothetical protein [Staphylothermus sp.]